MTYWSTDQERADAEAKRQAAEDAAKAEQMAVFDQPGYGGTAAPPPPPPPPPPSA